MRKVSERSFQILWKVAGYKGYFTGHSLRRSGATRLSNGGIPKNIIKECTGHRSDAVDKYMVTSNSQKELCSKIVKSKSVPTSTVSVAPSDDSTDATSDKSSVSTNVTKCNVCKSNNMSSVVTDLLKGLEGTGKAKN